MIAHGSYNPEKPFTDDEIKYVQETLGRMDSRRRSAKGQNTIDKIIYDVKTDTVEIVVEVTNDQKTNHAVIGSIKGGIIGSLNRRKNKSS